MGSTKPTLTIDEEAIAANTRTFAAATDGALMAVVKANGFGHGVNANLVLDNGASWLGVATLDEAFPLRARGIEAPILSWLNPIDGEFHEAIDNDIDLAIPSEEHLRAIAHAARALRKPARVHLYRDVGLARDGAPGRLWSALCQLARQHEREGTIAVVGVMAHLSSASAPADPVNESERLQFVDAVHVAHRHGLTPVVRHLAATSATLNSPETHCDLSRVGAGLYGIDPSHRTQLRGAMTLTAPVVAVRDVPPGTGVGYNHEYFTDAATRLVLLPLGYADGVPRASAGKASVHIRGVRRPVVGAVSMDQIVVDVGHDTVDLGEIATVLGPGGEGEPTMAEWALWSDTIEHEIVTGIGFRVARTVIPSANVAAEIVKQAPASDDRGE